MKQNKYTYIYNIYIQQSYKNGAHNLYIKKRYYCSLYILDIGVSILVYSKLVIKYFIEIHFENISLTKLNSL